MLFNNLTLSKLVNATNSSNINVKHILTTLYRVLQQTVLLAAYLIVILCLYLIVDFMF